MSGHKTIEDILTESFSASCKVVSRLVLPFCCMLGLGMVLQFYPAIDLAWLGLLFIIIVVSIYSEVLAIFVANDYCQGTPLAPLGVYLRRVDLNLIFENVWLSIRVAITFVLLALLLIIPGLVYLVNRMLSLYVLNREQVTVSDALRESKRLMTAEPWYRIQGPQLRLSGMLTAIFVLGLGVSFLGVFIDGAAIFAWRMLGVGSLVEIANNTSYQIVTGTISTALKLWLRYYTTVAVFLFYVDLKSRYPRENASPR